MNKQPAINYDDPVQFVFGMGATVNDAIAALRQPEFFNFLKMGYEIKNLSPIVIPVEVKTKVVNPNEPQKFEYNYLLIVTLQKSVLQDIHTLLGTVLENQSGFKSDEMPGM